MKMAADTKRTDRSFQVGELVLLKLQPYAQSSLINRPCPKLAMKFFGPYKILEHIGTSAYKLELPDYWQIRPMFHVSQLKSIAAKHAPVFQSLSVPAQLDLQELEPKLILDRRLSKRGSAAITQVLIKWSLLPTEIATWEDYHVVKNRYPEALA
jgi:hypothetical protein